MIVGVIVCVLNFEVFFITLDFLNCFIGIFWGVDKREKKKCYSLSFGRGGKCCFFFSFFGFVGIVFEMVVVLRIFFFRLDLILIKCCKKGFSIKFSRWK